jgi:hypothetical protein
MGDDSGGTSQSAGAEIDEPDVARVEAIFDIDAAACDWQQYVHWYLSEEVRHDILQLILGHPAHLVALVEFEYYLSESGHRIERQLDNLAEHELIDRHHSDPTADSEDIPSNFWTLTPFGVRLLGEFNMLRALPILRPVHDATRKSEPVQRAEAAPRPSLPDPVAAALTYDEPDPTDELSCSEELVTDVTMSSYYADATPADLERPEEGRTLDELF